MKKVISLLLVVLMLLPVLVSCGEDVEEGETKESVTLEGIEDIELEAQDFGGKEFKVLDANDHPDMHVNYAEDMSGSNIQCALYKRDAYIESRNNVNIVYTQVDNCNLDGISVFTNSYDAGDRLYDMVISTASGTRLATLSCSGYFTDLAALPTLDLSQKWWSSQMYEQMSLGGKMYFSTGDIMASVYDAPMVMYANTELLQNNQITDNLYQKVLAGDWTVEYMNTLVKDMSKDLERAKDDLHAYLSRK